jgi:hypothetical protein
MIINSLSPLRNAMIDSLQDSVFNVEDLGGGYSYILPEAFILESFDSALEITTGNEPDITLDSVDNIEGVGAVRSISRGIDGHGPICIKRNVGPFNIDSLGTISAYIKLDDDVDYQCANAVELSVVVDGEAYSFDVVRSASNNKFGSHWGAISAAEIVGLIGNYDIRFVDVRTSVIENAALSSDIVYDSFVANAAGRPTVVLTFDDVMRTQYTFARGELNSRGLKGTFYIPTARVGAGDSTMSWSQLSDLYNDGHDMQADGTSDDTAMTTRANPDDVIAELEVIRSTMLSYGFTRSVDHLCYTNGITRDDGVRIVKESVTSDGSDVITMSDTSDIVAGMKVSGVNVPKITRVISVDSGIAITIDNNIAAQTKTLMFTDDSGEFHGTKLIDALRSAGWKTGRTTIPGAIYTRFGFADGQRLVMPAYSSSEQTATDHIARVDGIRPTIESGLDMLESEFSLFMTYLKEKVDEGVLDVETISGLYSRDGAEHDINVSEPPSYSASDETRVFRFFDGVNQYVDLGGGFSCDQIRMAVWSIDGDNTGLPAGAPTITARKVQTIDFAFSGTITELAKNGSDYFNGWIFDVEFLNAGDVVASFSMNESGATAIDSVSSNNGAYINNPLSETFTMGVEKAWIGSTDWWKHGTASPDGSGAKNSIIVGKYSNNGSDLPKGLSAYADIEWVEMDGRLSLVFGSNSRKTSGSYEVSYSGGVGFRFDTSVTKTSVIQDGIGGTVAASIDVSINIIIEV